MFVVAVACVHVGIVSSFRHRGWLAGVAGGRGWRAWQAGWLGGGVSGSMQVVRLPVLRPPTAAGSLDPTHSASSRRTLGDCMRERSSSTYGTASPPAMRLPGACHATASARPTALRRTETVTYEHSGLTALTRSTCSCACQQCIFTAAWDGRPRPRMPAAAEPTWAHLAAIGSIHGRACRVQGCSRWSLT